MLKKTAGRVPSNTDDTPKQSIQVITRAINVLRALEGEPEGLSLGQIAQRVGLARSTVQRIVDALRTEQFVIAASPTAGVRLGPALIRLAASASVEFDQITRPIMAALSQAIGETVDLSVLKGNGAIFTDQVQGPHRLRAVSGIGETFPLHCTANGKALLALMAPERRERLLSGRLKRYTNSTVTDRDALEELLREGERSGLAYDLEEHSEGICAVGTAFLDPIGREYSLSIPVPATRFPAKRQLLGKLLKKTRADLLEQMGRT